MTRAWSLGIQGAMEHCDEMVSEIFDDWVHGALS